MRITVLGATGGVGGEVVRQGLAAGHRVTAVVRDPARLAVREHAALTVVTADALSAAELTPAVEGADAVLSAMGAASRKAPLRVATGSAEALVAAMRTAGARRLLAVSAAPLNSTGVDQPWLTRTVFNGLLWRVFGDAYRDLEGMERALRDSGLAWTAVRPPRLTDAPGRGSYRLVVDGGPPSNSVARADVARALLDLVEREDTVGRAVGVSA
ncbi:NAD(P)H-binding protein [Streptomyces sp. 3MP-14]|uniref:NAD(P)H-binding protein n=1 Tax=Streptomyces mimosae TaxID=2586635 RepID=A0A5N6A0G3_9ACTN|nr:MULTISPECIES: NAD(P)H-binding protein [Streptomyces]KAB8161326.1 NAD(P)H-binding protein [Streptomyces mimosae]KAB8173128.1 NAD(P)H-binding protein [Streptomyces sp. 3MP-14]